jgi:ribosomal protein L40E
MSADTSTAKVILGCSQCGATLPDGAQFCLQCGKPVAVPKESPVARNPPVGISPPKKKRRWGRWIALALLLVALVWVVNSDNPFAQGIQELAGFKHDQSVLDKPFPLTPHNFRYYKFALPQGSTNVSIIGQFTAAAEKGKGADARNAANNVDNNVEVYVLSEAAFAVWQNGYAATSVYESGRVAEGTIQAELPAGAGIYYLVFNNKFSPKTAKNVTATVSLRYKSWLPEWFRRSKERMWNWLGL